MRKVKCLTRDKSPVSKVASKGKITPKKKKPKLLKTPIKTKKSLPTNSINYINVLDVWEKIKEHKNCFPIANVGGIILFCKKIELSINVKNENSIFQPYERTYQKSYNTLCLMYIVNAELNGHNFHQSEFNPTNFDEFIPQNFKIETYKINEFSEVDKALNHKKT